MLWFSSDHIYILVASHRTSVLLHPSFMLRPFLYFCPLLLFSFCIPWLLLLVMLLLVMVTSALTFMTHWYTLW